VLEEIEDRLTTLSQDISDCKKRKSIAEKEVKGTARQLTFLLPKLIKCGTAIKEELQGIREQHKNHEAHLEALENGEPFTPTVTKPTNSKKRKNNRGGKKGSQKRRRSLSDDEDDFMDDEDSESEESESESDSDSESDAASDESDVESGGQDESMEPVTEESLKEKIKECKEAVKAARERNNEARLRKKEASDALSSLEKTLVKVQREKNAFCSLKRSEVRVTNTSCYAFTEITLILSSRATYSKKISVQV
jgi:E3 ubiquitin-protein ligase DOA10